MSQYLLPCVHPRLTAWDLRPQDRRRPKQPLIVKLESPPGQSRLRNETGRLMLLRHVIACWVAYYIVRWRCKRRTHTGYTLIYIRCLQDVLQGFKTLHMELLRKELPRYSANRLHSAYYPSDWSWHTVRQVSGAESFEYTMGLTVMVTGIYR